MRFTIVVAKHDTESNAARYDDFVKALGDSLHDLGHEVVGLDRPGRLIAFNVNNILDPGRDMPEDAILFNTEQLAAAGDPKLMMLAARDHRHRVVWDYSEANAKVLREQLGFERVVHCPVGYHPSMTRLEPGEEDIDVLFYGAVSPQRAPILDALSASGLRVKCLYGVYGAERDAWIARSKVVLNLHFGFEKAAVFEMVRVSHLLANRKCVVSEAGGVDEALDRFAQAATAYTRREDIVECCRSLVASESLRRAYEQRGFTGFSKTNMVENVKRALELS